MSHYDPITYCRKYKIKYIDKKERNKTDLKEIISYCKDTSCSWKYLLTLIRLPGFLLPLKNHQNVRRNKNSFFSLLTLQCFVIQTKYLYALAINVKHSGFLINPKSNLEVNQTFIFEASIWSSKYTSSIYLIKIILTYQSPLHVVPA